MSAAEAPRRPRGRPLGTPNRPHASVRDDRLVLIPWMELESADVSFAAAWAKLTPNCVRVWCRRYALGRQIGGRWHVSRLAFAMFMESDHASLARYHAGDRVSPEVIRYWTRMQSPLR